jgi:hypothetical protein
MHDKILTSETKISYTAQWMNWLVAGSMNSLPSKWTITKIFVAVIGMKKFGHQNLNWIAVSFCFVTRFLKSSCDQSSKFEAVEKKRFNKRKG